MQFLQAPFGFGSLKGMDASYWRGGEKAKQTDSYGAGPDACKGTAGIYLAFVY